MATASLGAQAPTAAKASVRRPATALRFTDTGKAALTAQMYEAVKKGDAPGIVEAVVDRDGVLYQGSSGLPIDAIFNIASMTKPVTSVAIMMLAEQGKLKIDDPVSKYLDGYDTLQVITTFNAADASYDTRPAKTVMTIKHLLAHTSGIGYSFTNPIEYALVAKTRKGEWELPLLDDPGTKFNYSASTRVLGFTAGSKRCRRPRCPPRPRRRSAATAASIPRWRTTRSSSACCSTTARWAVREFSVRRR